MATTPRNGASAACTERVNLSLTKGERKLLQEVGDLEERDVTSLAAWFVRWGLHQYLKFDGTLAELSVADVNYHQALKKNAQERLRLRKEAMRHVPQESTIKARKRA